MRTLWRGFVKTIFWSYERGSWPYDVMVIAILIVVLATPRSWFHDEPRAEAASGANVEIVCADGTRGTRTYRIQAQALPENKRAANTSPELERETHDILSRSTGELKGRTFEIQSIHPFMGENGRVAYYDVEVRPRNP
jgi:hypothetical protein